ncbi:MAG: MATE family efflux transporter [Phycisphaerales bacterium]
MSHAAIHPDAGPGSQRPIMELLRIAGPTVATMTSYTLMQFVDKFLVAHIGPDPVYVGAQGNGGLAAFVPIAIAMGILTVINTYVSQNLGAGRPERGPAYAWNGLWIAAVYWAAVLLPFAFVLPRLFDAAGMAPEQARLAADYGRVLVFGAILTIATRAIAQFFYGMHRAGIVLVAGLAANILNIVLSALLIFGNGEAPAGLGRFGEATVAAGAWLGIRPMGIAGSAWGTVIATAVELAIPMALFLGPRLNRLYGTRAAWRPSLPHIRDLLRIGWPGGLMFGNEMVCWSYFMVHLVSGFGKHHATAGWIAHQYMQMSFMPTVGISVACTALVGKYMGMGRPDLAARRARLGLAVAMVYMGVCGAVFIVFREPLIGFFVQDHTPPGDRDTLIRLGSLFLIATATFQLFDAVAMVLSGSLRGAGDTVAPGIATVVLSWLFIVAGGEAMTRLFPGLESLGAWIAAASYIGVLSLYFGLRFARGKWRSIRLVEGSPGAAAGDGVVDGIGPQAELAPPPVSRPPAGAVLHPGRD